MKKLYQIPKSQLVVIIVFGVIGELVTLVSATECYDNCGFLGFLSIFIPFLIVFYLVGWLHYNNKKGVKVLDKEKKESSKFCVDCGQINIPSSSYCLKCGSRL